MSNNADGADDDDGDDNDDAHDDEARMMMRTIMLMITMVLNSLKKDFSTGSCDSDLPTHAIFCLSLR